MAREPFNTVDEANDLLDSLLAGVESLLCSKYEKLNGDQLLNTGKKMEHLARKLRAAQIVLVNELQQQGVAASKSVSSTAVLVRQAFQIPAGEASARVAAATATLPQDLLSGGKEPAKLPVLGAAIGAGVLDGDHVRTVLATMRQLPSDLPADVLAVAETTLVEQAEIVEPDQFRKVAAHLRLALDPDGSEPDLDGCKDKVEFSIGQRSAATGLTSVNGRFDDLSIAKLRAVLNSLGAPRPTVDGIKDTRHAATRNAHALIETIDFVLHHGNQVLPETGGERPHVTVTLDWDLLQDAAGTATLDATGYPMSPATVRHLLCDANIIPAVLKGRSQVLDVGRSQRLFNKAIRQAITVRDRGCAFPGCDRPPAFCDAHHIKWWERDLGDTNYENGTLLCGYHHSEIHKNEWQIITAADGTPEFVPPPWIDPHQTSRRNTMHHINPLPRAS